MVGERHELLDASVTELVEQSASQWVAKHQFSVVEFYGSWCIYHLLTKRKNEKLCAKFGQRIAFASVDICGQENEVQAMGIEFVPTIAMFHGSRLRAEWAGDTEFEVMADTISGILQDHGVYL